MALLPHYPFLFHLKISDYLNSRLSPNRVTYTGTAIPHCTSIMPIQTESTGSHSRKMRFAEIPALFYLIISGCHSSRHNPLLFTFTGNNTFHCRHVFARNGILPLLSNQHKTEANIKSVVCVSYLIHFIAFSSLKIS